MLLHDWLLIAELGGSPLTLLATGLTSVLASLRGNAKPALFLDVRGRIQGEPVVWDLGDRLLLVEEPASVERSA